MRVELTRADLVKVASSVKGLLNARTAASATRTRVVLCGEAGPDRDPDREIPDDKEVIAVVTFEFDPNEPVT